VAVRSRWENESVDYRKWAVRLGATLGVALLIGAGYAAMVTRSWCSGRGVCDAPAPDYIHLRLAVMMAAVGLVVLTGTVVMAAVWEPEWLRQWHRRNRA
jgi:hypothetical protein